MTFSGIGMVHRGDFNPSQKNGDRPGYQTDVKEKVR